MGLIRISRRTSTQGRGRELGRDVWPPHPHPAPLLRISLSELGPNYSQSVPHYFSQLLISASKGSLPAVIAKDPSLCAEQAPGTAVWGGANRSCTRPRAHPHHQRHTLDPARALPPPAPP